jgi:hypothetical protein
MTNPRSTHSWNIILSICVSLFFSYAARQCLDSYTTFEMESTRLTIAGDQVRQAKAQRKRVEQYNKAMDAFATFESQVRLFGLSSDRWQSYDVSVQKSLNFDETGNILDQLSHNKTYYFIPAHLFIGTGNYRTNPNLTENEEGESDVITQPQSTTSDSEANSGDVSFSVQGRFMVRDGI